MDRPIVEDSHETNRSEGAVGCSCVRATNQPSWSKFDVLTQWLLTSTTLEEQDGPFRPQLQHTSIFGMVNDSHSPQIWRNVPHEMTAMSPWDAHLPASLEPPTLFDLSLENYEISMKWGGMAARGDFLPTL